MKFTPHFGVQGHHARLSASKYSWLNYDFDQLERLLVTNDAAVRGTRLHALAQEMIKMGIQARNSKLTFNMYVNDCIGYRMDPEVVLFYSIDCFGTVDAISFRKRVLRVSDLKTGTGPTSMKQLLIYVALFCLEYNFDPFLDMDRIEMRIYQNDEVRLELADAADVKYVIEKIKNFVEYIEKRRELEGAL